MKFEKSKLETIKNALQYAVISAKTESETAEFGLLLLEVQSGIESEKEWEKRKKEMSSLDGCPFVTAIAFQNAKVSVGMLGKLSHNVSWLCFVAEK